jgi:hypothetical protein
MSLLEWTKLKEVEERTGPIHDYEKNYFENGLHYGLRNEPEMIVLLPPSCFEIEHDSN